MPEKENEQIKDKLVREDAVSVKTETIMDEFLETAARYPEFPAVEDENGLFSYAQLDTLSNMVAEELMRAVPESAPSLPRISLRSHPGSRSCAADRRCRRFWACCAAETVTSIPRRMPRQSVWHSSWMMPGLPA